METHDDHTHPFRQEAQNNTSQGSPPNSISAPGNAATQGSHKQTHDDHTHPLTQEAQNNTSQGSPPRSQLQGTQRRKPATCKHMMITPTPLGKKHKTIPHRAHLQIRSQRQGTQRQGSHKQTHDYHTHPLTQEAQNNTSQGSPPNSISASGNAATRLPQANTR